MSEMIHCFACGNKIHSSASTCPSCGAIQSARPSPHTAEIKIESKVGWNWYAAFFQGVYYAGKGKFGIGLMYNIIGLFPLIALINFFRLGSKANSELTQKEFHWGSAMLVLFIQWIVFVILIALTKKQH